MNVETALKRLPPSLEPLATELATYFRHLPELLSDPSEVGRYVVVRGDQVCGTWDTYRDALQYGYERFGTDAFLAQKIDARDLAALAPYFTPGEQGAEGEVECRS